MTAGRLINEAALLWLTLEGSDQSVFEKLSDSLRDTIRKSPEYLQLVGADNAQKPANRRKPAGDAYREQSQSLRPADPLA
jgi:hypothetical protein